MKLTVVLPPWLAERGERQALMHAAAAMKSADTQALDIVGRAAPAAVAARVAALLPAHERQLVIFPAGSEGEEAAAVLAALLRGRTLGRCTGLALTGERVVATRAVFGGRAQIRVHSEADVTCAALRPPPVGAQPVSQVRTRPLAIDEPAPEVEALPAGDALPRVEGASIVVCGGRGVDAAEGFALLARIARSLGAGLGGSLPAVDAGWLPVAHQVGQSGKFVSPRVYFAVGISGTPQHLAGVSSTARIVALNTDRNAPIFAQCDIAVEGDWREILPPLARELEALTDEAPAPQER